MQYFIPHLNRFFCKFIVHKRKVFFSAIYNYGRQKVVISFHLSSFILDKWTNRYLDGIWWDSYGKV